MDSFQSILVSGIKCNYLLGNSGEGYNGKYYISLFKLSLISDRFYDIFCPFPKIVLKNIIPFYANKEKNWREIFLNTIVPLRTSTWNGEYQQFLKISLNKIVAFEYSLAYLLKYKALNEQDVKMFLNDLKEMIIIIKKSNIDLPILDTYTKKIIDKDKVLSLKIEKM